MKDSLSQYRLRRLAIEQRRFTVTDLTSASGMSRESVQAFIHRLDKKNSRFLTKEDLAVGGRGRPLRRYTLTPPGIEFLATENAPLAHKLNEAALAEVSSPAPAVVIPAPGPSWGQKLREWWRAFEPEFQMALDAGATAFFLKAGELASIRVADQVSVLPHGNIWTAERLDDLLSRTLTRWQTERLEAKGLATNAAPFEDRILWALRVQLAGGLPFVELRKLPAVIPTIENLHLPVLVEEFTRLNSGLVLITGIGGSGRSGFLAAMVDRINRTRSARVVTLEEPVLYLHAKGQSLLEQRQISIDAPDFAPALNQAIEDDAQVLALTELSDAATSEMAIAAAERSLVFCRVTAADPESAIRKITDLFPPTEHAKIRARLAANLAGIVAVTGVRSAVGTGIFPATAVLRVQDEARKILEDPARTYLLAEWLETESPFSHSLRSSLDELCKKSIIDKLEVQRCLAREAKGTAAIPA